MFEDNETEWASWALKPLAWAAFIIGMLILSVGILIGWLLF